MLLDYPNMKTHSCKMVKKFHLKSENTSLPESGSLQCIGCKKSDLIVKYMISFPEKLGVCDGCVGIMVEVIAQQDKSWRESQIQTLIKLRNESSNENPE